MVTKGLCSAASLAGSAPLPFVILTGAQRSGEISVWMLFLGNVCDSAKRSGGTCGFFPPYSLRFAPAATTRRFDVQDVALGQVLAAFAG